MDMSLSASDPALARILDMVSAPASGPDTDREPIPPSVDVSNAQSFDALPLAWQDKIRKAGSAAFHAALDGGASKDEAIQAGQVAAELVYDELSAPIPPTMPATIPPPASVTVAVMTSSLPAPKSRGNRGVENCEAGRARSQNDVDTLRAHGFAMKEPIYDRGTMVVTDGIKNARRARREYDGLPLVGQACADLISKIEAENRRFVEVDARDVRMTAAGNLILGSAGTVDVTEHGFAGLVEKLGYGGAAYLAKCPPALRAHNVNEQRVLLARAEDAAIAEAIDAGWTDGRVRKPEPRKIAARVRDRAATEKDSGGPEVFAVVSPGYPAFDADQIAEAFRQAMPSDARGTVRYDPGSTGTRFEALFHTTVAPEHFVAGEVFRTGIRVRANDSGDGSIVVRAVAFQNLCLNLIVIDRAGREIARIRHVGTVEKLREEFARAMVKASGALAPFMKQWGYACEEDVAGLLRADGVKLPTHHDEIMRGIFAGVLASKRVRFPRIAGKGRAAILDALIEAWRADVSSATARHHGITRASVVNAITRASQGWLDAADPWATDAIELDAASLLWGHGRERPAPLAFVDLDKIAEQTEIVQVTMAAG